MSSFLHFLLVFSAVAVAVTIGEDTPTLFPVEPFDPYSDAQVLRDAIDGWGTDEDKIISVLCHRAASQREEITNAYSDKFGRSLVSDLKSDLSGTFQTLAIMLTYRMSECMAIELHETMAGAGTDEASLTEILLSRTNKELEAIRADYQRNFGISVYDNIRSETCCSLSELLCIMAEGVRDESTEVDYDVVKHDVTRLYLAGQGRPGTDDGEFVSIFSQRSYPHMNEVSDQYYQEYGLSLESAIATEFEGNNVRDALLKILSYARNKNKYFSERFLDTTIVTGTKDRNLMRLTVSRCEIDLQNIKDEYDNTYGHSLSSDVSSDTSGSYGKALLQLIG